MKQYSKYEVADFLFDDSFVKWAQQRNSADSDFWSTFLQSYPEKVDVFYQAKKLAVSIKIKPSKELSETEVSELIQNIAGKTYLSNEEGEKPEIIRASFGRAWLKIAAMLILVASATFLLYRNQPHNQPATIANSLIEKINTKSEPILIRLPDNSSIILKAHSKISYLANFAPDKRVIYLDGEAFFEVSKDKKRPFLVYANDMVTKVLGTSFLVKAFKESKQFSVVVNTGKVSVFPKKLVSKLEADAATLNDMKGKGVLITPNEAVTYVRSEAKLIKKELEKPTALSDEVTKTTLNFIDTPFSEVVKTVSKAYDIKIDYDSEKMAKCPLTASLTHQSLYEKLSLICKAVEANYEIVDGVVIIKGKGCESL